MSDYLEQRHTFIR